MEPNGSQNNTQPQAQPSPQPSFSSPTPPAAPMPPAPNPVPGPQFSPNMPPTGSPAGGPNKLIIIIAASVVGVLFIGGLVLLTSKSGGSYNSGSSLVGQDVKDDKSGAVGDTLKSSGLEVGITSIDKKAQLDQYTTAESGKIFMIATVTIKNGTKDNLDIFPADFKLNTSDKRVVTGGDYYGSSNNLPNDALAPGGSATGVVVFEVEEAKAETITLDIDQYPKDTAKDVHHFNFTYKI